MADSTPNEPVHVVTLLNDSEAAMVARLNLIRAAQHNIDVQTYIWDQDDAGQLMLNELIKAAQRGRLRTVTRAHRIYTTAGWIGAYRTGN